MGIPNFKEYVMKACLQILAIVLACNCLAACHKSCEDGSGKKHEKTADSAKS